MQWKHRKLDSEANWSTSKLNKQQTEDYSTIFFWEFLLNSTLIMNLCKILYNVANAVLA